MISGTEGPAPRVHREVVSFVRRSTRMTDSQLHARERFGDRYIVPVRTLQRDTSVAPQPPLDWDSIFGRPGELVVEIGSGNGESLVAMAKELPQANIVAFEVFEPAVASTLSRLARDGVDNVRLVVADGSDGLTTLFEDASIWQLWTFFADPWHKTRHHKRRLINTELAQSVATKLRPGGHWRLATDWAEYAEWMLETIEPVAALVNQHERFAPRWDARPVTKYEQRGIRAGREIFDLHYRRAES